MAHVERILIVGGGIARLTLATARVIKDWSLQQVARLPGKPITVMPRHAQGGDEALQGARTRAAPWGAWATGTLVSRLYPPYCGPFWRASAAHAPSNKLASFLSEQDRVQEMSRLVEGQRRQVTDAGWSMLPSRTSARHLLQFLIAQLQLRRASGGLRSGRLVRLSLILLVLVRQWMILFLACCS